MANRIGQQLGNYQLLRLLGQGGFAEVYLGQHIHIHLQAAIKVLHTQLGQNYQAEFLQEANTIARLKHPHIIRILDFGVESRDLTPYLIMDYAPYGTLRNSHPKGSIVPLVTVFAYIKQIAQALQYAHDRHLIHRDLKPENLLVGENGEILLSDFGIAALAHSTSTMQTATYAGTIPYSAPEQILGKPRRESDQYALGIILYEWLTGDRPFKGTMTEIVSQHLGAPPNPIQEKVPDIPSAVESVIMRTLAKDPHQRFDSIQTFADALEQAFTPSHVASEVQSVPSLNSTILLPTQSASVIQHFISRRKVLAGLTVTVVAGSGLIWLVHSLQSNTPTTSVSTPTPVGITLFIYRGHSNTVTGAAWSPDGKRIASGSMDKTVQVWDVADGGNTTPIVGIPIG